MNNPVSNTGNNISRRAFSRASRHAELYKFLYIQKGELIPSLDRAGKLDYIRVYT